MGRVERKGGKGGDGLEGGGGKRKEKWNRVGAKGEGHAAKGEG